MKKFNSKKEFNAFIKRENLIASNNMFGIQGILWNNKGQIVGEYDGLIVDMYSREKKKFINHLVR